MDEIDRKIISQLMINGRTTFEDLSKKVGLTGVGVKKRVKKLIEQEVIKVSALLNFEKMSMTAAMVLLEIENAEAMRQITQRFKDCPRVVQIFSTLGGYNLVALVVAEDRRTLESTGITGEGEMIPGRFEGLELKHRSIETTEQSRSIR